MTPAGVRILMVGLSLAAAAPARGAFPDTLAAWPPAREGSVFDGVSRRDYLRRHALSLDHYLEFTPGGLIVRAGPIGNDAAYSRWGIGRGRGTLLANGIVLNDPQNGIAPWVHVATSGLGRLRLDEPGTPGWIEGSVLLTDLPPPASRPGTFIELSRGTNDLRQRRVRFSSEAGRVGVDLSYDEVLDDGYAFDAAGIIDGTDFGKSRSRNSGLVLRGAPDDRADFTFGIRQFESTTDGDLASATAEARRDGHLAWLEAGTRKARITIYGRGYDSQYPDSASVNETVGAAVMLERGASERTVRLRLVAEQTSFTQDVGARFSGRLAGGRAEVSARTRAGSAGEVFAGGSAAGDEESDIAWGAVAGIRRATDRSVLVASATRSSRLPTLGERFLPAHARDGRTIAGDAGVNPEHAFEARADWEQRAGAFVNRARVSWIAAERSIAFRPRLVDGETWRVAANAESRQTMLFAEERLRAEFGTGPLRSLWEVAVTASSGDREEAFSGVPEVQASASAMIGGEMFEATSAVYVGAEYLHMDGRVDYHGRALPAFDVVNLLLEARLIDARLYVRYLNVTDAQYTTLGDHLMTPRTLVYGIAWTLFN